MLRLKQEMAEMVSNMEEKTRSLDQLLRAFVIGHRQLLKHGKRALSTRHELLTVQSTTLRALLQQGEFSPKPEEAEYTSSEEEEYEYEGPAQKKRRTDNE